MKSVITKIKNLFCVKDGNASTPKVSANKKTLRIFGVVAVTAILVVGYLSQRDTTEARNVVETDLHDTALYDHIEGGGGSDGKIAITYISKRERLSTKNRNEQSMYAYGNSGREYSANQVISNGGNDIPPGTLLKVRLVNKLISSSKNQPVIALLTKDYYHLGTLAIPRGTKLLGQSQHDEASRRIQVAFNTMVFPDQKTGSFSGIALDLDDDGSAGLKGRYSSKRPNRIFGSLLSNFVSGFAEGMQDREVSEFGEVSEKGSLKNAILNGTSSTAVEHSKQFADGLRETTGTITIQPNYDFLVFIDRDFHF